MVYTYDPVDPIVETKYGKLRGYCYGDVNHFLGIRYAQAKRFQLPTDPPSWEGIKNVRGFGPVMLQMHPFRGATQSGGWVNPWFEREDCQYLNVWAPKPRDGELRPVFVWMHGGGYFSGSSVEFETVTGFNMAHDGNVVYVSMNHRLNILGHLNLTDYGEEFKYSKNVGIYDLVAALKWIHENIEAFGGDPNNVTIAGHSGGGGKVQCMYQIEAAKDYFQRGIVVSGVLDNGPETREADSRAMAKAMMDNLGITKENASKVYDLSFQDLLGAYNAVVPELRKNGVNIGMAPLKDDIFQGFPSDVGFAPWSKDKPMILSSTIGEFNFRVRLTQEQKDAMTEQDKLDMIRKQFGEHADKLIELFKAAYPTHDLLDLVFIDTAFRIPTLKTAEIKAKASAYDNTYVYLLAYNMPQDHRIPAWHGADVAYILWNTDKQAVGNEPVYGERISNALKYASLNFAVHGDPNHPYLPEWKPYTADHHYTMVIDKKLELKEAFDEELIDLIKKATPPFNFHPEA